MVDSDMVIEWWVAAAVYNFAEKGRVELSRDVKKLFFGRVDVGPMRDENSGPGTMEVGEAFQAGTKYRRGMLPRGGLRFELPPREKEYPGSERVALPAPRVTGGPPLWRVVAERRSVRSFAEEALSLEEASQALWAATGVTALAGNFAFRAAPSAGALYPVETYLVARLVEDLSPGVYHYHVRDHALELVGGGEGSAVELARAALDQRMVARAAASVVWTAVIGRSAWKYAQRAYRYVYLDAAHVAQNFMLAATGLGLGTCGIGAFYDDEVNRVVGVDGVEETALYICVVGRPARKRR